MPVGSRLAIWCIASLLCISLYLKGRAPAENGGDAALSRPAGGALTVRLAGDFPRPGVYLLPEGASPLTAIKMTLPSDAAAVPVTGGAAGGLESGDIVTLNRAGRKNAVISVTKMGVRERMLLGIALHPDEMGVEEWSLLPGIGPRLSRRIVDDRHNNGDFGSVEGLLRVPGIGPGKLAAIRKYF